MKALDIKIGEQRWQQERRQYRGARAVVHQRGHMIPSYDPSTGIPAWNANYLTMATCGTCVWTARIVIPNGGFPDAQTAAVSADGSGRVLWTNRVKCYEQSILCRGGSLYALADNGIAHCWDAGSGREIWKIQRSGPVSASPLLVGGKTYAADERGTMFVFKASPEKLERLARNRPRDESFAPPAVADNLLSLRVAHGRRKQRQEVPYAIAEQ